MIKYSIFNVQNIDDFSSKISIIKKVDLEDDLTKLNIDINKVQKI